MTSFILVGNKDNRKLTDSAKDLYYEFIDKYNYSEEEITWHLARKGIEFQGIENILFDFQDYILDHIHEYGYSYENEDYEFIESKKSMKESINGDCYIYYDDDDGKRNVFCDYVKGITDTRNWFYLDEYIIDAIHIFKNEKQAQKFIDEHLKYFADQDKVVIAEYPQTVSEFFESKESARKSIKEGRIDKGAVVYAFSCMLNELGFKAIDYSNEENNEKCDDIVYMIMDLLKTMPRL